MRKRAFIILLLAAATAVAFLAPAQAADDSSRLTLAEIGRKESMLAAAGNAAVKLMVEETWRARINEILAQLEKKGVKIDEDILDAVVSALGIDKTGPLTGESWSNLLAGSRIEPLDQQTIQQYMDPSQYILDTEHTLAPEPQNKQAPSAEGAGASPSS